MLTARTADKYDLYAKSVQTPEADARFLSRYYRKLTGRSLRLLREDFCGTGQVLYEFVKLHRLNRGIGVDLDPEPLQWSRQHLVSRLPESRRSHLELIRKDVTTIHSPKVQMIAAMNFSYSIFWKRQQLIAYFKNVRKSLLPNGVFVIDAHGGREVPESGIESWNVGSFKYLWEVSGFDPISHRIEYRMHFVFRDGSRLQNAFVYRWRLWTLPELREALEEAGFVKQHILWEATDKLTGLGNGRMHLVERAEMEGAWYAMLISQ